MNKMDQTKKIKNTKNTFNKSKQCELKSRPDFMKSIATQFLTLFLKNFQKKNPKIAKKQQKPKNYILDIFASLAASFSTCSVVNALFKVDVEVEVAIFKTKSKFTKGPM